MNIFSRVGPLLGETLRDHLFGIKVLLDLIFIFPHRRIAWQIQNSSCFLVVILWLDINVIFFTTGKSFSSSSAWFLFCIISLLCRSSCSLLAVLDIADAGIVVELFAWCCIVTLHCFCCWDCGITCCGWTVIVCYFCCWICGLICRLCYFCYWINFLNCYGLCCFDWNYWMLPWYYFSRYEGGWERLSWF